MKKKGKGMEYYSELELQQKGFRSVGNNNRIDKTVCFYHPDKISIGSNVIINAFCVITGNITLEDKIYIGEFSFLTAKTGAIHIKENVSIYQRTVIDADRKEKNTVMIDTGIQIETQCVITNSISAGTKMVIPMLSVL